MRKSAIVLFLFIFLWSCGNSGRNASADNSGKITQREDGTIALNIESAAFYQNNNDPSLNTAEWNFVVLKPGRYGVWLSSATRDTMNLGYHNKVRIDLNNDERLEAKPVGDKIIADAAGIQKPYYRADSYMGSFYIQSPGEYSIQVISEKIINSVRSGLHHSEMPGTMLLSVFLTPVTR